MILAEGIIQMKTKTTTRIIAAALMFVVILAAFAPFIAFSEDPASAGEYILRLSR